MDRYLVAAIQLTSTADINANLDASAYWIDQASRMGAELIGLPENFSFLGPEREKLARAAEIQQRSEAFLIEQAAQRGVVILGGGFAVPRPSGKALNRALLVGPDGPLATYDKMHLFDVDLPGQSLRESDSVEAGEGVTAVAIDRMGTIGLSICYDLRFPELYRRLSALGADVLFVPAAFTAYTGQAHWELLLRTRAVENTCYVVAPAQCGRHFDKRTSYGHALIVDPWGMVLADAGEAPGVALGELSPERIRQIRAQIPVLRHRRLDRPQSNRTGEWIQDAADTSSSIPSSGAGRS